MKTEFGIRTRIDAARALSIRTKGAQLDLVGSEAIQQNTMWRLDSGMKGSGLQMSRQPEMMCREEDAKDEERFERDLFAKSRRTICLDQKCAASLRAERVSRAVPLHNRICHLTEMVFHECLRLRAAVVAHVQILAMDELA